MVLTPCFSGENLCDPWRVLVAALLLQTAKAAAVVPVITEFMRLWPTARGLNGKLVFLLQLHATIATRHPHASSFSRPSLSRASRCDSQDQRSLLRPIHSSPTRRYKPNITLSSSSIDLRPVNVACLRALSIAISPHFSAPHADVSVSQGYHTEVFKVIRPLGLERRERFTLATLLLTMGKEYADKPPVHDVLHESTGADAAYPPTAVSAYSGMTRRVLDVYRVFCVRSAWRIVVPEDDSDDLSLYLVCPSTLARSLWSDILASLQKWRAALHGQRWSCTRGLHGTMDETSRRKLYGRCQSVYYALCAMTGASA